MTAAEAVTHEVTEIERIEAWRAERLERAGYEATVAGELSARHEIDLHRAVDLLRNGCPPEIAVKILL